MGSSLRYISIDFEGEYLHGKEWNGEITKSLINVDSKRLIFRYKLLNGEKNGKGVKYYTNRKLKFEGEYLNGKKWNGKGYNIDGNLEFELKNGNGKVKKYYDDGKLKFEGEYLNGEKNGYGSEKLFRDLFIFEGEYKNGKKWNGKLNEYFDHNVIKFKGQLINGEKTGAGKEYDQDGNLIFEGEYLNGERNGIGKEYDQDGNLIFEGEYLDGKRKPK